MGFLSNLILKNRLKKFKGKITDSLYRDLQNNDPNIRSKAVIDLGKERRYGIIELLIKFLKDNAPIVKSAAVKTLGKIGDKRAIKPLLNIMVNDNDYMVRRDATMALLNDFHDEKAKTIALRYKKAEDERVEEEKRAEERRIREEKSKIRCSVCSRELQKSGNPMDDIRKQGGGFFGGSATNILYETWLGTVCTHCKRIYCHRCRSVSPGPCPKCGKNVKPASLMYL